MVQFIIVNFKLCKPQGTEKEHTPLHKAGFRNDSKVRDNERVTSRTFLKSFTSIQY